MPETFLEESLALLSRTPAALDALLRGLPEAWTSATEGEGTWSPYDVVGHLVHAEKVDWLPRLAIIMEYGPSRPFDAFDREAQFRESQGRSLPALLDEFGQLRRENVSRLCGMNLQPAQLALPGTHPVLGAVTARQLIATWTAHDMAHVVQIGRVLAKRYRQDVGPWAQFLSVMK